MSINENLTEMVAMNESEDELGLAVSEMRRLVKAWVREKNLEKGAESTCCRKIASCEEMKDRARDRSGEMPPSLSFAADVLYREQKELAAQEKRSIERQKELDKKIKSMEVALSRM